MNEQKKLCSIKDGQTFEVAGIEFIKFPGNEIGTPVVTKNILFRSEFGRNNNLTESAVLEKLKKRVLCKIIDELGEENVLAFKTDLTTWDGLKPYEDLESRISLPTMDFYRENVEIFDQHKVHGWWWLATPESAQPHEDPCWTLCVSPFGYISYDDYYYGIGRGVRPFCIFKSSIFGPFEK